MADKRITNLPVKTDPTLSDEMHINDVVSNFDKKMLLSVLRTLLSVPYMQVSLSNYDNDSAPAVKQGSSFDSKGVPVDIGSDLTPTGYAGISNSTTFYVYWDESAGSFIYSATVPTWTPLYQGWYNGDDRALFSMYKDSTGNLYESKQVLNNVSMSQNIRLITSKQFLHSASMTFIDIWTALNPYIPNVGDIITIHGGFGVYKFSRASRLSTTQIQLYGISAAGSNFTSSFTSSTGGSVTISMSWDI